MKHVLLVTYHNWESKRLGGFHKLAEALCASGYSVGFLSYPRPIYAVLKNNEYNNVKALWRLLRGVEFKYEKASLVNYSIPSFHLPGRLGHGVAGTIGKRLASVSVALTIFRTRNLFPCLDAIVFESCLGLELVAALQSQYPKAILLYRPSDPMVRWKGVSEAILDAERHLLNSADSVLLVNTQDLSEYGRAYRGLKLIGPRVKILPNGVDLRVFRRIGAERAKNPQARRVTYIGAMPPDWGVFEVAASALRDVEFAIICPEPPNSSASIVLGLPNVSFIQGVPYAQVPEIFAGTSVLAVAYDRERTAKMEYGLHGKLLQAMAARVPIVSFGLSEDLRRFGIVVTSSPGEFTHEIRATLEQPAIRDFNCCIEKYDWLELQRRFVVCLENCMRHGKATS